MMTENIQLNECPPDEQVLRDPGNDDDETLQPDVEYRNASQIHHTAEACSSQIPNVHAEKKSSYFVDDSSSTCSTDSVPLVVKGPYNGNISANSKNKRNSSRRGKKQQNQEKRNSSTSSAARLLNVSSSSSATGPEPKALICAFEDQIKKLEQTFVKKSSEEEVYTTTGGKTIIKDQIDGEIPCNLMTKESSSSSTCPSRKTLIKTEKKEQVSTPDPTSKFLIKTEKIEEVCTPELALTTLIKTENSANQLVKTPQNLSISKCEAPKHQESSTSRPCSAPVIHRPKPTVSPVSASQTVPQLSRTLSSINCLKSEPSLFSQNLEPQSYRNAIMGIRKTGPNLEPSFSSSVQSTSFSQPSSSSSVNAGVSFGSVRPEALLHDTRVGSNDKSVASSSHSQGTVPDEFPHLDIINDLLDDDGIVGMATFSSCHLSELYPLNWQQNFLTDVDPLYGPCQLDLPEYYCDDEMSQMVYDSFMPFYGYGELHHTHSDFSVQANGTDALLRSHWPINGVDLSMMNFGSMMDVNGYAYQMPEYATCGVGGCNEMYHPRNEI